MGVVEYQQMLRASESYASNVKDEVIGCFRIDVFKPMDTDLLTALHLEGFIPRTVWHRYISKIGDPADYDLPLLSHDELMAEVRGFTRFVYRGDFDERASSE